MTTTATRTDAAYSKRRRYLKTTGRSLTTDATQAADHLRQLLNEAGNGWPHTAATLGVAPSQIYRLVSGGQKTISRARAEQILALRPNPVPEALVPATRSTRQMQALIAAGHPRMAVIDGTGLDPAVVSDILNGRKTRVQHRTAALIDGVYRDLSMVPGASARSLNRAVREGWAPPAAWDGIDMSDPSAFPDFTGRCGTAEGAGLHYRHRVLPVCGPCRGAAVVAKHERAEARAATGGVA